MKEEMELSLPPETVAEMVAMALTRGITVSELVEDMYEDWERRGKPRLPIEDID